MTIRRNQRSRRSWRWSLVDLALVLLGGWVIFDEASRLALGIFIIVNGALAAGFMSSRGRNWIHPSPWDLPVVLLGNLLLLAGPLFLAVADANRLELGVALGALLTSRTVITVYSARHIGRPDS